MKKKIKDCERLRKLIKNPKDEYYTKYCDIENEISLYKKYLKDKIIYCCADNLNSNFYKYFKDNFLNLGIKKLICTSYNKNSNGKCIIIDNNKEYNYSLKEDGDFRSTECINFFKESDIIITNPPFSLFKELIDIIIKYNKKFILIGAELCITNSKIFNLYKENIFNCGFNIKPPRQFLTNENIYKNINNALWYQNITDIKRKEIEFIKIYNEKNYLKYVNYPNAINVDFIKDIPKDYFGEIGVPVTFIKYLDRNKWEIIGLGKNKLAKELGAIKINNRYDLCTYKDNNYKYYIGRIIIKRK